MLKFELKRFVDMKTYTGIFCYLILYFSFSDAIIQTKEDRIGSVYRKVMLKQFTDGSFRREIKPAPWMGYVGPLLRGETGDVLYVHFRNMASRPYNLHPHGVQYFKDGEGICYLYALVSFYVYIYYPQYCLEHKQKNYKIPYC